jgi:hypothetical protein
MNSKDTRKIGTRGLLAASRALAGALIVTVSAQAAQGAGATASIDKAGLRLAPQYGDEQFQRLAKKDDRDSLIAAALVGLPNDTTSSPPDGHAQIVEKLANKFSSDPLALYTVALICNAQREPCTRADDQAHLLAIAPDNAINYLLLPNGGKPSSEQLHAAAAAGKADSHYSELLGIVRSALKDQPPPKSQGHIFDGTDLALVLRRNELAEVPWPMFGPTMESCSPAAAASAGENPDLAADCAALGRALFADKGQNIVTRTYGGTLVRRFAKGSPEATAATEFRRQFLWLDAQPKAKTSAEKELINADEVKFGEWEAYQRHAERAGSKRAPPADWAPENAELLLLPEERTPAPADN